SAGSPPGAAAAGRSARRRPPTPRDIRPRRARDLPSPPPPPPRAVSPPARADRERFGAAPAAQLEATLEHEQQRVGVVAFVEQRLARGEIAFLEERGEFLAFAFAEVGEEREAFELGHIARS